MTNRSTIRASLLLATLLASAALAEPTTAPAVVDAGDQAALTANLGKEVVVEGVVDRAAWSNSGKVMTIDFKDVDKSKFGAVAFVKLKERLDKAFMGDAAKDFTGAKLRIRGTIAKYGGKVESLKDSLQVVITDPAVVTIVEPAAGGATTAPAM